MKIVNQESVLQLSRGRQGFALILPCLHLFLAHPHLGVGGERSETEGGLHLFLAHPHLGGG